MLSEQMVIVDGGQANANAADVTVSRRSRERERSGFRILQKVGFRKGTRNDEHSASVAMEVFRSLEAWFSLLVPQCGTLRTHHN
jgi:hypothetical protein